MRPAPGIHMSASASHASATRRARALALAAILVVWLSMANPGVARGHVGGEAGVQRLRPVPRTMGGLPGVITMDMSAGVPIVQAEIGGLSLRLVVDTGASWSLLTPATARRLGIELRPADKLQARDAAGETRPVEVAHIETMTLPSANGAAQGDGGHEPVTLGDFDLIVMDSPVVAHAGADGILGLPMFRRLVARFDFAAGRLKLGGAALPEPDGLTVFTLRAMTGGLMSLEATFEPNAAGRAPSHLLLDTGFSGELHLSESAATDLAAANPATRAGVTATAHRRREFQHVRLDAGLLLGRYHVARPNASVFPGEGATGQPAIGTALLKHFTLTLDLPHRRARLERQTDLVRPDERAGSDAGEPAAGASDEP